MIFATVGTQLPFDRLLTALDGWARLNPHCPVRAQSGATTARFAHLDTVDQLSQSAFRDQLKRASLIVAHAGMGTILSAAELGKPVILMPRRAKFGEHRNDHQEDTAAEMAHLSNVTVVQDGEALQNALDTAQAQGFPGVTMKPRQGAGALDPLIDEIRDFIWHAPQATGWRVAR